MMHLPRAPRQSRIRKDHTIPPRATRRALLRRATKLRERQVRRLIAAHGNFVVLGRCLAECLFGGTFLVVGAGGWGGEGCGEGEEEDEEGWELDGGKHCGLELVGRGSIVFFVGGRSCLW